MSFESRIPVFPELYKRTEQDHFNNDYDISYQCRTIYSDWDIPSASNTPFFVFAAILAIWVLIGAGVCAYKCGQKKTMGNSQQNASGYQNFEANNMKAYGENEGYAPSATTYEGNNFS